MSLPNQLPNHSFHRFTRELLENNTYKQLLLALQKDYNLNLNIILFCFWVAYSGRGRLNKKQIKNLITATYAWHENIVLAFRDMWLRLDQTKKSRSIKKLQAAVTDEEKTAEHIEQLLLTEALPELHVKNLTLTKKAVHTIKNFATYCQLLRVQLNQDDCAKLSRLLIHIYPKIDNKKILEECKKQLTANQFEKSTPHQQKHLKFN